MPLPDFIVIGSAKSATTSLYNYLSEHPEIGMCLLMEANFFAFRKEGMSFPRHWRMEEQHDFPARTRREYEALFPVGDGIRKWGDVSSLYLEDPYAPARIRQLVPNVRLLVTLRDPVDRVISYYKLLVRKGWVTSSIDKCLQPGQQLYELSFTGKRLENFYRFFPDDRIRAIRLDDLQHRAEETVKGIWRYLDVDESFVAQWNVIHNKTPVESLRTQIFTAKPMVQKSFRVADPFLKGALRFPFKRLMTGLMRRPPEFRESLKIQIRNIYAEDVHLQERLTGLDLSGWLPQD